MSDVSRIEVKVGALIVVCVLLLVGFVFLLSDFQFGESSELQVDFDTSAGLKRGAPVKVSGLTAGRIEQVTFHGGKLDPELKRPVYVRVHLTIDPEIGATLKKDARFFITTIGLLGEKYVEIDPGESTEPLGTTIPLGVPPMRIEVMAANMNTFLAVGANLLKENRQAVKDTIDDVRAAVKSARQTVEEGREMVAQAKKQLNNIATNKAAMTTYEAAAAAKKSEKLNGYLTKINKSVLDLRQFYEFSKIFKKLCLN